ncbi:MAG: peptide chain release factor N(5)-glutamine methyltransferase [Anaerolineaceae bacterium]|nr:peptide chain release factor N(5)-glutamine methyltransferase [Anaerolineaceae bacterium]
MSETSSAAVLKEQCHKLLHEVEKPHDHALVLLAHVLGESKTWVLAHPELYLSQNQISTLEQLHKRLTAGEPLAYLTGKQAFYGRDFSVNKDVLIPRPESELMVSEALSWLKLHPAARQAVDLGTGSGCIAISLAAECPGLSVCAVDISSRSLMVAMENAMTHRCEENIRFIQTDLFDGISKHFNLVCANLPYIPSSEVKLVNSLPFEPRLALDGGRDGLRLIEKCMQESQEHLQSPALLLFEFQYDKAEEVKEIAGLYFPQAQMSIIQDLAGLDRIIRIEIEEDCSPCLKLK